MEDMDLKQTVENSFLGKIGFAISRGIGLVVLSGALILGYGCKGGENPNDLPEAVYFQIRNNCQREYSPDDAILMKSCRERQEEAYRALLKSAPPGISESDFESVKKFCEVLGEHDFRMQAICLKEQTEKYGPDLKAPVEMPQFKYEQVKQFCREEWGKLLMGLCEQMKEQKESEQVLPEVISLENMSRLGMPQPDYGVFKKMALTSCLESQIIFFLELEKMPQPAGMSQLSFERLKDSCAMTWSNDYGKQASCVKEGIEKTNLIY